MFETPVINVAIGLVFCFAATALAASTVTEALASLNKPRANSLVTGLQTLLNCPQFNGLALSVYNHALVHLQGDGGMGSSSRRWSYRGPSYIKAANFACAKIDVRQQVPGDLTRLQAPRRLIELLSMLDAFNTSFEVVKPKTSTPPR